MRTLFVVFMTTWDFRESVVGVYAESALARSAAIQLADANGPGVVRYHVGRRLFDQAGVADLVAAWGEEARASGQAAEVPKEWPAWLARAYLAGYEGF